MWLNILHLAYNFIYPSSLKYLLASSSCFFSRRKAFAGPLRRNCQKMLSDTCKSKSLLLHITADCCMFGIGNNQVVVPEALLPKACPAAICLPSPQHFTSVLHDCAVEQLTHFQNIEAESSSMPSPCAIFQLSCPVHCCLQF